MEREPFRRPNEISIELSLFRAHALERTADFVVLCAVQALPRRDSSRRPVLEISQTLGHHASRFSVNVMRLRHPRFLYSPPRTKMETIARYGQESSGNICRDTRSGRRAPRLRGRWRFVEWLNRIDPQAKHQGMGAHAP